MLGVTAAVTAAQQVAEVRESAHLYTPPQPHISAQTKLVEMEAVVRDLPGGYMVRVVLQDAAGKMAAQNQAITISK